jgi:ubiquinone/menaquinone biosynthesis C-methylase UbiE
MTKDHPHSVVRRIGNAHDYLPAAGHDVLLPGYDLLTRVLGMGKAYGTLIEQAELAEGMSVLEVGCGTGNVISRVKRAHPGVDALGIDPDPRALARAQKKSSGLDGIRFERGYIQELPYGDCEFDRVLSSMMFHHLDDDVKDKAAGEMFRLLRPGGRLHLVDIKGGEAIVRRLRDAGFDCAVTGTRRLGVVGTVTFHRAERPVDYSQCRPMSD